MIAIYHQVQNSVSNFFENGLGTDISTETDIDIIILQEEQYEVLFVCITWYATHWKTGYYLILKMCLSAYGAFLFFQAL